MSGLLSGPNPGAASMLGNVCGAPLTEEEEGQLYTDPTLRDWIDAPPTAYSFSPYSTICARYRRPFSRRRRGGTLGRA